MSHNLLADFLFLVAGRLLGRSRSFCAYIGAAVGCSFVFAVGQLMLYDVWLVLFWELDPLLSDSRLYM